MPGNIYDNTHAIQRRKKKKNQLFLNLMEKAGGDGIAVSSTGSLIVLHPCNENARLAFMNSPHLIQFKPTKHETSETTVLILNSLRFFAKSNLE